MVLWTWHPRNSRIAEHLQESDGKWGEQRGRGLAIKSLIIQAEEAKLDPEKLYVLLIYLRDGK